MPCLGFHPFINPLSHPTPALLSLSSPFSLQASQLGVYKAFVDNYKVALETAEKCSQSNNQFQKISEVGSSLHSPRYNLEPSSLLACCQLGKWFP